MTGDCFDILDATGFQWRDRVARLARVYREAGLSTEKAQERAFVVSAGIALDLVVKQGASVESAVRFLTNWQQAASEALSQGAES